MIRALVDFALNNRFVVLAAAVLLLAWGGISFHNLPDRGLSRHWRQLCDDHHPMARTIRRGSGTASHHSRRNSDERHPAPFDPAIRVDFWSVVRVRASLTTNPITTGTGRRFSKGSRRSVCRKGVQPQIGTDWSLVGQIYWYTIRSTNPHYDLMDMRTIEDWVLLKEFKSVPNIVDVSDFGGTAREYQVRVDPNKLISYGLSIGQVEQQLANNNVNAGGSFVETGMQQMNIRALGLYRNSQDIEQTVLTTKNGTRPSRQGYRRGRTRAQEFAWVAWPGPPIAPMARSSMRTTSSRALCCCGRARTRAQLSTGFTRK